MTKFMIRTSYAGRANPKVDIRNATRIVKPYAYKVEYQSDKGVCLMLPDEDFAKFKSDMRRAGISYLIDKDIE
jgi:hypothetical protein